MSDHFLKQGWSGISASRPWMKIAGLFAAAAICGAAYNSTSPLGIRFSQTPATQAPAPVVYSNDTLALEARPVGASPSAVVYQLDSVKLSWRESKPSALPPPVKPTSPPPARKQGTPITWPEAAKLIAKERALVVDARPDDAFRAGHIPGAVNLPFIHAEKLIAGFKNKFPVSQVLIIYCSDLKCPVSASLADLLMNRHGYHDVRILSGGYLEWQTASNRSNPAPLK